MRPASFKIAPGDVYAGRSGLEMTVTEVSAVYGEIERVALTYGAGFKVWKPRSALRSNGDALKAHELAFIRRAT